MSLTRIIHQISLSLSELPNLRDHIALNLRFMPPVSIPSPSHFSTIPNVQEPVPSSSYVAKNKHSFYPTRITWSSSNKPLFPERPPVAQDAPPTDNAQGDFLTQHQTSPALPLFLNLESVPPQALQTPQNPQPAHTAQTFHPSPSTRRYLRPPPMLHRPTLQSLAAQTPQLHS